MPPSPNPCFWSSLTRPQLPATAPVRLGAQTRSVSSPPRHLARPHRSAVSAAGEEVLSRRYSAHVVGEWHVAARPDFSNEHVAMFAYPLGVPVATQPQPTQYLSFTFTLGNSEHRYVYCVTHSAPVDESAASLFRLQLAQPLYASDQDQTPALERLMLQTFYAPQAICLVSRHPFHMTYKAVMHTLAARLDPAHRLTRDERVLADFFRELASIPAPKPGDLPRVARIGSSLFRFPQPQSHQWGRPIASADPGRPALARSRSTLPASRCAVCGASSTVSSRRLRVPRRWALRAAAVGACDASTIQPEPPLPGEPPHVTVAVDKPCPFALPVCDANLRLLLERLEPRNVIAVVAAVLCERKLLFTARQLEVLHDVQEALLVLLWPVQWPHTYIPILPASVMALVDCPTPFIMGAPTQAMRGVTVPEDVICVDVDANRVVTRSQEAAIPPR